jgi:hypothetical protein
MNGVKTDRGLQRAAEGAIQQRGEQRVQSAPAFGLTPLQLPHLPRPAPQTPAGAELEEGEFASF